jgi:PPOX class probable F420-dependent enzyme
MTFPLAMTTDEREQFLADVHIGVLAVAQDGGAPLAVPVWYRYRPGGVVEISTSASSVKVKALRAAGQAALCVQREQAPYAYVTVTGPVTFDELSDDDRLELAVRYLGEEMGRRYVESSPDIDNLRVTLTPQRWHTTDYAKLPAF